MPRIAFCLVVTMAACGPRSSSKLGGKVQGSNKATLTSLNALVAAANAEGQNWEPKFSLEGGLIVQSLRRPFDCPQTFLFQVSKAGNSESSRQDVITRRVVSTGLGETFSASFVGKGPSVVYASTHGRESSCRHRPLHVLSPRDKGDLHLWTSSGEGARSLDESVFSRVQSCETGALLFDSARSGDVEIYYKQDVESPAQRLTNRIGFDGDPSLSADCKRAVWRSSLSTQGNAPSWLSSYSFSDNRMERKTFGEAGWRHPSVAVDGQTLATQIGETSALVYFDRASGRSFEEISEVPGQSSAENKSWSSFVLDSTVAGFSESGKIVLSAGGGGEPTLPGLLAHWQGEEVGWKGLSDLEIFERLTKRNPAIRGKGNASTQLDRTVATETTGIELVLGKKVIVASSLRVLVKPKSEGLRGLNVYAKQGRETWKHPDYKGKTVRGRVLTIDLGDDDIGELQAKLDLAIAKGPRAVFVRVSEKLLLSRWPTLQSKVPVVLVEKKAGHELGFSGWRVVIAPAARVAVAEGRIVEGASNQATASFETGKAGQKASGDPKEGGLKEVGNIRILVVSRNTRDDAAAIESFARLVERFPHEAKTPTALSLYLHSDDVDSKTVPLGGSGIAIAFGDKPDSALSPSIVETEEWIQRLGLSLVVGDGWMARKGLLQFPIASNLRHRVESVELAIELALEMGSKGKNTKVLLPKLGMWVERAEEEGSLRISAVKEGGPASRAGVKAGDRLLEVGGHTVSEPVALERQLVGVAGAIALRVQRASSILFLRVDL